MPFVGRLCNGKQQGRYHSEEKPAHTPFGVWAGFYALPQAIYPVGGFSLEMGIFRTDALTTGRTYVSLGAKS